MTFRHGRILAFFLVLSLLLPLLPGGSLPTAHADSATYGRTTANGVRLRKSPSLQADYWFQLNDGFICTIEGETTAEGIHWYKVISVHPESNTGRTYIGYLHGDFFRRLTDAEEAELLAAQTGQQGTGPVNPIDVGDANNTAASDTATGTVTNGGTNFREEAGMYGRVIMKLDRGTVVQITSIPPQVDEYHWYGVYYAGYNGFIRSDFIRLNSGSVPVTVSPTAGPTPTATSNGSAAYNAVQLILTSCHLRTSPAGSFDSDNDWVGRGSVLPLDGSPVSKSGYIWYPVRKDNKTWYVRNDCVQLVYSSNYPTVTPAAPTATPTPYDPTSTATPTAAPTTAPTAVPTATPATSTVLGYVMTIKGGCNLRSTIGGTVIRQIGRYRTMPYLLPPVQKNGYTWYYVEYEGTRGYLRGDVVKVVSSPSDDSAPNDAPDEIPEDPVTAAPATATPSPTPYNPDATPTPTPAVTAAPTGDANLSGYVVTIASGVNLRTGPGYTPTVGRVDRGVRMPYYGEPTEVKGVLWYHVKHPTLGYGYIHGGYVNVVNADGSATQTPTGSSSVITPSVTSTSQVEASYTTLQLGSTGTAVRNLVTALKEKGYYTGEIISRYTTAVRAAVRAFQKAVGLTVDGIAGAATQHALFGTVPVGAADSSNLTMSLYAAEKIDWWTGGINELWVKGTNYKVYDVKTGIVWWAHRWSGGYHVDAEPLTAADTARLCKCYGVTTAQEIANRNLYQRRPLLVTIGTRTFACSLYGVPHNYPEGDTIPDNEFRGQVCIHFTNSWTHGSRRVDSLHTEAIQYAWMNAPNGHK